jgi:FG-GAP repeat protein
MVRRGPFVCRRVVTTLFVGLACVFVIASGPALAQGSCGTTPDPCLVGELRPAVGADTGFGTSMDVSGNLLVVGAPVADPVGEDPDGDTGAVYPFHWDGFEWIAEAPLYLPLVPTQCPAGTCLSGFGQAVSIGAERLLVGATRFGYASCALECSAVFAYRRESSAWVFEAQLPYPADQPYAETQFGIAVATDGQYAAVGDRVWPDPPDPGGWDLGRVYLYRREGTCWNLMSPSYLESPGGLTGFFGWPLAMDAGRLAVGAHRTTLDPPPAPQNFWAGAVYVYQLDSIQESWTLEQALYRPGSERTVYFGASLSMSGPHIAVGAILTPSDTWEGRAYVYGRSGGAWVLESTLRASDAQTHDEFGAQVCLDGDNLLVSTSGDRFHGPRATALPARSPTLSPTNIANSAYLFQRTGGAWLEVAKVVPYLRRERLQFGQSLALHGDRMLVGAVDSRYPRLDMISEFAFGGADCNGNGVPDDCDLRGGTSSDANGNHVPDECED